MAKIKTPIFIRNSGKPWHNDLFNKVVAVITIFGAGVATGLFINSNDHKIELMQANQQFNEKLHEEINKYRDCKISEQDKKINELNNTVQILNHLNGNIKKK